MERVNNIGEQSHKSLPRHENGEIHGIIRLQMGKIAVNLSNQMNKIPFIKRLREPWLTIDFPTGPDPFLEDEIMRILEMQDKQNER